MYTLSVALKYANGHEETFELGELTQRALEVVMIGYLKETLISSFVFIIARKA